MIALFAGSFHPPTLGHLDVIERGAKMFERVTIAVMVNSQKRYLIPAEARADMLKRMCAGLSNVDVVVGTGLTAQFAHTLGACVLLRGVRGANDLEDEMLMAHVNHTLTGVDTVFLPARPEHMYISSTVVNDILRNGGSIDGMVPSEIIDDIRAFAAGNAKGV